MTPVDDTTRPRSAADRLADRLEAAARPGLRRAARQLHDLGALDEAVYRAVAQTAAPTLDPSLRRLSRAADRSVIWMGIAGGIALVGGDRGRRAARGGLISIAVTSAVVNLGIKAASGRQRPDRSGAGVPDQRHVRMPMTTSFPSGHSAAAFAFATAVGSEVPALALPLRVLATAVAYSRVHTGVHYPGDAIAGSAVGAPAARGVTRARRRRG
jgi:membrane-associated phospholipid phosphatase